MSLLQKIKKKAASGTSVLMLGTLSSQLIPFLISPILTRFFSPEEFGAFGLYFSITMVVSVFITGRYEMAIILPKNDEDSANVLGLSLLVTLLISFILLLVVLVFSHQIALLLKSESLEKWLIFLPITMLSIGTYQSFNYWNNRKEKYGLMSLSRITRSVNTSGASLILAKTTLKNGGLILADVCGQFVAAFFLVFRTLKSDKNSLQQISLSGIKTQAKRYSQFPKYNVPSGFFEKMSGHSPVFLISSFFGEAISGFFSFSQRIIAAPASIISRAIGDVFRQKANKEFHDNGNCTTLFIKTLKQLVLIGLPLFTVFYFIAPELFAFVFGEKWRVAGEYAQIMTVMFLLQFIVSPLSNLFLIAEKQNIDLVIQILLLILIACAFVLGYNLFKDVQKCILLFTFVYSAKYLVELYLSYQFSKQKKQL